MSNLGPQKILFSYNGLLQVPGGLTSSLQDITDANGVSSGLQISTTGFSGAVISDTVTITGGTINGTTIGAVNPAAGTFSTLKVDSLAGILKATTGTVSAATANTDYLTPPSGTAILKANSGGALANATSGVDYAPATSGSSILSGDNGGGFTNVSIGPGLTFVGSTISTTTGLDNTKLLASNGLNGFASVTVGSGLQYSGGVLASTSGGGSVTTVSVVSANGFTGTVANASSTPAITLATSVTGLLKGNGTAISAATAGTDYQAAITATGILKGAGSGAVSAAVSGTDYAPATSGTSILKGDGAGGFSAAVAGTDYAGLASANTFTNNQVISVSSASDALRITQTGAGNALVVEDSANPDATPFVVSSSGVVGIGTTTPNGITSNGLALVSSDSYTPQIVNRNKTNDVSAPFYIFDKDRANAIVQNSDSLGFLYFRGYDGATYTTAASITAAVDGTPGTNDMPGRLVFSTTADGASSPTERMRIDNAGAITVAGLTASSAVATDANKKLVSVTNTGSGNNVLATSPTLTTATITGSRETKTAPSISAGTLTLDCSAGNVFAVSLNASITTLSFSNVPTTGTAYALTLSFTADGTARTVTWGSSVKWPSGTAPTLTSTNGKVDTFVLTTWDGGTTWYAFTAGQNA